MMAFNTIALSGLSFWIILVVSLSLVVTTLLSMAVDFLKTYRTHNFGPALLWLYRSGRHRWLLRLEPFTRHLPFTDGGTRALGNLLKAYIYRAAGRHDLEARCLSAACGCPLPAPLQAECQVGLAVIDQRGGNAAGAARRLTYITTMSGAPTGAEASMIVEGDLALQRAQAHGLLAVLSMEDDPETAERHVARAVELDPTRQTGWYRAVGLYQRHPHLKSSDTAVGLFLSGLNSAAPGYVDYAGEVGLHLRAFTGEELEDHVLPFLYRVQQQEAKTAEDAVRREVCEFVLRVVKKSIPVLPETRLLRCILSHMCGEQPPRDSEHEMSAARAILQTNPCDRIFRVLLEPLIEDFEEIVEPIQVALVAGLGSSDQDAADAAGHEVIRSLRSKFSSCDVRDAEDLQRWMWEFVTMLSSDTVTQVAYEADKVMVIVPIAVTVHKGIPDEALNALDSLGLRPQVSRRVERSLFNVVARLGGTECRSHECGQSCGDAQRCGPTSVSCDCLSEAVQMAMAETSLQVKLPSLVAVAIVAESLDRPLIAEQCIQAARLRAQQVSGDHQQVSIAGMLAQMLRPHFDETAREIAFSVQHTWCRYSSGSLWGANGPNKYMAQVVVRCIPEIWR